MERTYRSNGYWFHPDSSEGYLGEELEILDRLGENTKSNGKRSSHLRIELEIPAHLLICVSHEGILACMARECKWDRLHLKDLDDAKRAWLLTAHYHQRRQRKVSASLACYYCPCPYNSMIHNGTIRGRAKCKGTYLLFSWTRKDNQNRLTWPRWSIVHNDDGL